MSTIDFSALEHRLTLYRNATLERLLAELPDSKVEYLWKLVPTYPQRSGKGLRPALCIATCRALGASMGEALNTAVAIELLHNAFLVHDDAQDSSRLRRGQPSLYAEYGTAVAINVGNALSLLALDRFLDNQQLIGPQKTLNIFRDAQTMMHHTLEGQALEVAWIRDHVFDLEYRDYYRLCLKKTAWYTTIFPCRAGALIATGDRQVAQRLDRYGWYLGLAFQIQDDLLNLTGKFEDYGKEIADDLLEGKRTLVLIHLLRALEGAARKRLEQFLRSPRQARTPEDAGWVLDQMAVQGSLEFARRTARHLAGAAFAEVIAAMGGVSDSVDKGFLFELPLFVVERNR